MNKREYDNGYQAAVDAIREYKKQQRSQGNLKDTEQSTGQSTQGGDGRLWPQGMSPENQGSLSSSGGQQGSGSGRGSGRQGVVRPEDCISPNDIKKIAEGIPGGVIDRKNGDKIAQGEGYDKGKGGSDEQTARDWKDRALKAAGELKKKTEKNQGSGAGAFASRLEAIYKPTKDWKKELKKIVGQAINPDDPRRAFANKNVLVSQNRIARTDKDQYDSLDYMVAMIDTSGSMSEKEIKACLGEVYGVALAKKPLKLVLIYFGGGPSKIDIFNNLDQFKKEMKSPHIAAGGGTEVEPCFRLLQDDMRFKNRTADLVMIFTDGYLSQVKRNPKICKNLCWVIVDNPGFDLQYKDINTKCVHVKTSDMN